MAAPAEGPDPAEVERKVQLLLSVGEECLKEEELRRLVEKKPNFNLYDGFEPSGRMHIAQGVYKAINVNKCTAAGGTFIFWVADWFALMNDKMGGDIQKIQTVGKYLIEVWKAVGMNMDKVVFRWAAEDINQHAKVYWEKVLDIARSFNLNRLTKCCQIMGRKEGTLTAAQILYPLMQSNDIFFLKADICQLGMDQRKVNMLARDYCGEGSNRKPIILSHHMLSGLLEGQEKMSKSDPESAIFMEDSTEDVRRKITNAYCPTERTPPEEGEEAEPVWKNPLLDYLNHIFFSQPGATFTINDVEYTTFPDLLEAFSQGTITPDALKAALIPAIDKLLQPVRDHFETNPEAKELMELVRAYKRDPPEKVPVEPPQPRDVPWAVVRAPLPVLAAPTLAAALSTLRRLESCPEGHQRVLFLPDWSAFVLNTLRGEQKVIAAHYALFPAALRALNPTLMESTRVILQSEYVLENANEYWLAVINAGRRFALDRVCAVDPTNDQAGHVIGALMYVADIQTLRSRIHVICPSEEPWYELAKEGLEAATPANVVVPTINLLLQEGEDVSQQITVMDNLQEMKTKWKKAFCRPGEVGFNPPLTLAVEILLPKFGSFTVSRKEENGGDKVYESGEPLVEDFRTEALHPADLKPVVTQLLEGWWASMAACLKENGAAVTALKNYQKKVKKSGGAA